VNRSTHESVHDPKDETQKNAQNDAGSDRKKYRSVLSAVTDVARQPSKRNIEPSSEEHEQADNNQQAASADQQFSERAHADILER
jgi:hypothetical protein